MGDFIIQVHPPYRGNSTFGMSGMGDGRYTNGAFVRLTDEEQTRNPDDPQRAIFIDQLLAKYHLNRRSTGERIDIRNAREIPLPGESEAAA